MAAIWCFDPNMDYKEIKYPNGTKFALMCRTFTSYMDSICIPAPEHDVLLLLNFLDNSIVPTDNEEQIRLVKVSYYCGLNVMSIMIKAIYKTLGELHGLNMDTIYKYARSKKDSVFDYKFCVHVLENLTGITEYQRIMNRLNNQRHL